MFSAPRMCSCPWSMDSFSRPWSFPRPHWSVWISAWQCLLISRQCPKTSQDLSIVLWFSVYSVSSCYCTGRYVNHTTRPFQVLVFDCLSFDKFFSEHFVCKVTSDLITFRTYLNTCECTWYESQSGVLVNGT